MKKLPISNELLKICPECKNELTFSFNRIKANNLRISSWVVFSFFVFFLLPMTAKLIGQPSLIANLKWWGGLISSILLLVVFIFLRVKIKKFESTPRSIACCSNCKKEWLINS